MALSIIWASLFLKLQVKYEWVVFLITLFCLVRYLNWTELVLCLLSGITCQLYLTLRRSSRCKNHMKNISSSADGRLFSAEISNFCYISKIQTKNVFSQISNSFDFYWVFIGSFNQNDCNFGDFSKINYFKPRWN